MWNCLDLYCPVRDVCRYPPESRRLDELTSLLTNAASLLTSNNPLWTEGEVLNNIQQKLTRLLRCDKCLQLLRRVGQCLRNKVLLTLSQSYLELAERFLVGQNHISSYMPSRQQLEYVLIRTQSAAMLLCEAIRFSRETFCRLVQRLQIGHMIQDVVIALSTISRLNIMFRALLVEVCDVYQKLYPWQEKLIAGTWKWPKVLNLPDNLEKWIDLEDSKRLSLRKEQVDFLTALFKRNEEVNGKKEESHVTLNNVEESDCIITDEIRVKASDFDYGEIVPREEVQEPQNDSNEAAELHKHLLCKALKAQSYKALRSIWNNIDAVKRDLLPRRLTLKKMRFIDDLFSKLKTSLSAKERLTLSPTEKKMYIGTEVNKTAVKFLKQLGYTKKQIELHNTNTPKKVLYSKLCNIPTANLVPVNDWTKLKKLYKNLQRILKALNENKTSRKLEDAFKSRKDDIKLLLKEDDAVTAENLIFCTSKVLLTMCKKQINYIEKNK